MVLTEAQRKAIGKADLTTVSKATLARRYRCSVESITRWVEEGKKPRPNYAGVRKPGRPRKLARTRAGCSRLLRMVGNGSLSMSARVGSRAARAAVLQHHWGCDGILSLLQPGPSGETVGSLLGYCCTVVNSGMGCRGLVELMVRR